ncbi:MAG: hypothetical protein ACUVWP_02600 [bacterium]
MDLLFNRISCLYTLLSITIGYLIVGVCFSEEIVKVEKFNISITFPDKWTVNSQMPYPMVLGADNYKNKSRIAITYMQNLAGKKPTRSYMKQILKETEDVNYKKTKPNYKRLSMIDYNLAGREAVWMEFTSADSSGDYHEVVVVFPVDSEYFIFIGLRCYEGIFKDVFDEFKGVLESIVFY